MSRLINPEMVAAHRKFIATQTWKKIREQRLALDTWRCTGCGVSAQDAVLEVHHMTYDRFGGNERMEDLTTLCGLCHSHEHHKPTREGGPIAGPTLTDMTNLSRQQDIARGAATASTLNTKDVRDRLLHLMAAQQRIDGRVDFRTRFRVIKQRLTRIEKLLSSSEFDRNRALLLMAAHTAARTSSQGSALPRTDQDLLNHLQLVEHTQDNPEVAHHWEAIRKQISNAEAAVYRANPQLFKQAA